MSCPKCGGILAREDGVVFCENPNCFHVVEREGDPRFPSKPPEPEKRAFIGKNKGKICRIEGCNDPVRAKGMCKKCSERIRLRKKRGITPDKFRGRYLVRRVCKVSGCEKKHLAKGYCKRHYNLTFVKPPDYRRVATPKEKKCTLCMRLHFAKGLCRRHYSQVYYLETKWKYVYEGAHQSL